MTFPALPDTVRFDRSTGTGSLAAPVLQAFDAVPTAVAPGPAGPLSFVAISAGANYAG